ncbi:MAG: T9SS type A sorting domain-containing protein [bacterium]|nr:T9SS type A sorting domain-containing protein [bacterium]
MKTIYTFIFLFVLLGTHFDLRAQCTAASVPYYEGFQGISQNNQMPACWTASSPSISCLTFTTAPKYAAFYYNPGGTNYFFSKAILLNAGTTYSAALFYMTDNTGGQNWSNLSIMIGQNQSASGMVAVASASSPVISSAYSLLSGTFVVPGTGTYYAAIRGIGSNTGTSQYLNFDDFSITQVCGPSGIPPSPNNFTICEGQNVNLTACSPANTYSWSNGSFLPSTTMTLSASFTPSVYCVMGYLSSSCQYTCYYNFVVNPTPQVQVLANPSVVCAGEPAVLSASGANSYTWSNGSIGNSVTVTPSSTSSYTVIGTNAFGCSTYKNVTLTILPTLPIVVSPAIPGVCKGASITLSASGVSSYTWVNGPVSPTISVNPTSNSSYTVTSLNPNGCVSKKFTTVYVFPLPVMSINLSPVNSTICATQEIALDGGGALTYTWSYDGTSSNDPSLLLNPLSSTTFTLRGTNSYGCVGETTLSLVVDPCTNLNKTVSHEIVNIFPNPTSGIFTLKNAGIENCRIILCDLNGREILRREFKDGSASIDISSLVAGIYYLKIQSQKKSEVFKLVKE